MIVPPHENARFALVSTSSGLDVVAVHGIVATVHDSWQIVASRMQGLYEVGPPIMFGHSRIIVMTPNRTLALEAKDRTILQQNP